MPLATPRTRISVRPAKIDTSILPHRLIRCSRGIVPNLPSLISHQAAVSTISRLRRPLDDS